MFLEETFAVLFGHLVIGFVDSSAGITSRFGLWKGLSEVSVGGERNYPSARCCTSVNLRFTYLIEKSENKREKVQISAISRQ